MGKTIQITTARGTFTVDTDQRRDRPRRGPDSGRRSRVRGPSLGAVPAPAHEVWERMAKDKRP